MPPSPTLCAVARAAVLALAIVVGSAPLGASPLGGSPLGARPLGAQDGAPKPRGEGADTLVASRAEALSADDPLLPRGSILFEIRPTSTAIRGLYRDGTARPLGEPFLLPSLGVEQVPALAPAEARLRDLMGETSNWSLDLGRVAGRVQADEQIVPVRVGYGLLDRVTLGATVPFIRRRVSSVLALGGTGATAGENPANTDPDDVNAFLSEAASALSELEERVAEACETDPDAEEPDPGALAQCAEGQELLDRASGFLSDLEAAYAEESVFPLRGSSGATALNQRWATFRSELAGWQVESPDDVPAARMILSDEAFAATVVDPIWGAEAFPRGSPEAFMEIGDIEAHVVLGLLRPGTPGEGLRVRASLVGTVRVPTGAVDTLQAVVPFAPPRGVAAGGLRLVTDVASSRRWAVLAVAEGWMHGEVETVVVAPDPDRVLGEGAVARAVATWRPGPALRVRLVPRGHLTPSLSAGLGYEAERRGAGEYRLVDLPGAVPLGSEGPSTVHRIRGEFRFHGFEEPMVGRLRFPLEVLLAYDAAVGGSGPFAPRSRRVELGVRVRRGG